MKKRRVDDVAIRVMRKNNEPRIWYGCPNLIHEISELAGCKRGHPLNISAAVMNAIARSSKFKLEGSISHLGKRYNVYAPKP